MAIGYSVSVATPGVFSLDLGFFDPTYRLLGFFYGDLWFFLGFKKARVFLEAFQISPENTYFRMVFADKQVVFGKSKGKNIKIRVDETKKRHQKDGEKQLFFGKSCIFS